MNTFTSTTQITRPVSDIYAYLSDFNNHRVLMPDNVQAWSSDYNDASFNVQGITLKLSITERESNSRIAITPTKKAPFDLKLVWDLASNNGTSEITLTITAELNMMMKMMVAGPLQKLADHQTETLARVMV